MWIEKIVLFVMMMLALVGIIVIATSVHEYSHQSDFQTAHPINESICAVVLPAPNQWLNLSYYKSAPFGYYQFDIEDNNTVDIEKYKDISKYTEIKAYIITFLIIMLFIACYMLLMFFRYRAERIIIEQEDYINQQKNYINQLETFVNNSE